MELLYISSFQFYKKEYKTYALPSCNDAFFKKYLDVFSSVRVLGEEAKSYLDESKFGEMYDNRISVRILKRNTSPLEFVNDRKIKENLLSEIYKADAILIKPSSRKGIMAISIAKKLKKPYMIEITGDIHNALKQNPSKLKQWYGRILYNQILRAIKDCKYGLYVSESYLPQQFPIEGIQCGCSDVVIENAGDDVLSKRIKYIKDIDDRNEVRLGLIGFYQGLGKGVDTAIRALSLLPSNITLHVLGNGTEKSRNHWYSYAAKYNVEASRLSFPNPLPNPHEVLKWIDTIDISILPTRSEGLCRTIVESMSRGCPCVCTNICSMPELLTYEYLHPLSDEKALATIISRLLANKNEMINNAITNFNNAKNFDFDLLKAKRNRFLLQFKEYCETKDQ